MQYCQVRELLAEHIAWDTSQVSQLGLDGQEALDSYYTSGEEALPGVCDTRGSYVPCNSIG